MIYLWSTLTQIPPAKIFTYFWTSKAGYSGTRQLADSELIPMPCSNLKYATALATE